MFARVRQFAEKNEGSSTVEFVAIFLGLIAVLVVALTT